MSTRHIIKDGEYYLLLEPNQISREVANLEWCIDKANERIAELAEAMTFLDDSSAEYDKLEEEAKSLSARVLKGKKEESGEADKKPKTKSAKSTGRK